MSMPIRSPDGEVRSPGTIPNRAESIRKLIKKLGPAEKSLIERVVSKPHRALGSYPIHSAAVLGRLNFADSRVIHSERWGPEPQKFENRPLGPTILLFLCFEQLTAEPILLFRTLHTSGSR
jgi:hypothetical protein